MRLRAPLALLALLTAVLPGLVGIATPATAGDPLAGAPSVGACYDMTFEEAYDEPMTHPTDCADRHTLVVVGVHQLPASVDWDDSERRIWQRGVQRSCEASWRTTVGTNPALLYRTLYSSWWFKPSKAQRADGARWFTCAVGMTTSQKLVPLPTGPLPRPARQNPDAITRCGSKGGFVPCSARHQLRMVHTFVVRATGNDEARVKVADRAQARTCPRAVDARRWAWSWRSVSDAKIVVGCLKRTRR